jgi:outer membrane protein assembly factor BamD
LRRTLLAFLGIAVFSTIASGGQNPTTQVITNQTTTTQTPASQPQAKQAKPTKESSKKKNGPAPAADDSVAPDKVLYDRAQADIQKGRHEIGRLNLQTLINTYPDSEYLAKAKLAIADSYYKEGGSSNWTQAIAGYKDFIVFFPFLPEAPYAQMQVAMTHYREMEKPDRDRSEARSAEEEFQTFLAKYPNDPLTSKALHYLRIVQEVLAEGDFRIGYYYYVKGDRRAAAGRLLSVVKRYPLYSKSDQSLWMLGDIFEKSEKKEIASVYYSRIVKDYPLSTLVGDAKKKLVAFGVPVPQPDPKALAWMQAEAAAPREHPNFIKRGPMALVRSGPGQERVVAAQTGAPNMEPEADTTSAADVLTGGGKAQIGVGGGSSAPGNTAVVEIATPGTGASGGSTVESGDTAATNAPAPTGDSSNTSSDSAAPATDTAGATTNQASGAGTDASGPTATGTGTNPEASTTATSTDTNAKPADNSGSDSVKDSSSKKKKGLKKIIPW